MVGRAVEAGDDGNVERPARSANEVEVSPRPDLVLGWCRKIALRLRRTFGVHAGQMVVTCNVGLDLLFEERGKHYGRGPDVLEALEIAEVGVKRRSGRD